MCEITFPVGRMVGGSMYKPNLAVDDVTKQPVLDKNGKQKESYSIGFAIKKGPEQAWQQTEWGQKIYAEASTAYGAQAQHPTFSWKIIDGDSQVPNKRNKRPCDQTGYPGHWVLWFSQAWSPRLCSRDGSVELTEPDSILPGYFIQVHASVVANGTTAKPAQTPGVYLNPIAVALSGYGERIITNDIDTAAFGFGAAPLPAEASAVPVAAYVPPAPNPAILAPPPAPNPAILAPPPAPVKQLTALAEATYPEYIAAGWTDALLIQHGILLP